MYGIFTYIWLIFVVNVGKYTIHGSYGIYKLILSRRARNADLPEWLKSQMLHLWNIYLHLAQIYGIYGTYIGKYPSPMEHMAYGNVIFCVFF